MTRRSFVPVVAIAAGVLAGCSVDETSAPTPRAIVPQRPSAAVSQTINFPFPTSAQVGSAVSRDAESSSGLPIKYTALTPNICSVNDYQGVVIFRAIGDCKVAADQEGDADYLAAPTVTKTAPVSGFVQTIWFTTTPPVPALVNGTYTVSADADDEGAPYPVTFSSLTPSFCTVADNLVTFTADGLCIVGAHKNGDGKLYEPGEARQEIRIGMVAQVIEFTSTPPSPGVATTTYEVAATGGGSGNPVEFSSSTTDVCTVSGSTVTCCWSSTRRSVRS